MLEDFSNKVFVNALLYVSLENVLRSLTRLSGILASCYTFSGLRQQVKVIVEEFARILPFIWS